MKNKNTKQEPQKEWVLDWKQTLAQNSLWLLMILGVYIFGYFGLTVSIVENEMLQIMGLIFTLFFMLKMFAWVGHPRITLMEKK